jgi:hypothetical protein
MAISTGGGDVNFTALAIGVLAGAVLSLAALVVGVLTSRSGQGREKRLFAVNTFISILNLAVLAGVALAAWLAGRPLWEGFL